MTQPDSPILTGCSVLPPMTTPGARVAPSTDTNRPRTKGRTAERFATINTFVDCSLAELSRTEALAWLVLWRDMRNGTVRTSMNDIARRIGSSRRAITTAIGKLQQRGLLTIVRRGGLNSGPTIYRLQPHDMPP